ncbi:BZ3500_MvSof-1268-A1-R1_Chr8-2g10218 [Microbotryum saponariae]|uniref:BZ3500_MvSof-1268-A1-R1_Chr8-2g10218 protein n=1 Tax=Microbotryum saponariae TaxID=289078 RepID=A0A2X0N9M5_9BASI|nr:BZ3500_MvSof-1268-A1-R1_Chr8-2g10218 [Microbotryum saponariae]SDA02016.1 BZ3501_MvSof-1269-A2-R1_Chr8-2g09968 [Microbotryum saponariae]
MSRGQKRPRTRSDVTAIGTRTGMTSSWESPLSQAPKRPRVRCKRDDDEGEEDVRGGLAVRGLPTTNKFVLISTDLRHSAMIDDPLRIVLGAFMAGMFARSAGEDAGSGSMSSEEKAKLGGRRSQADRSGLGPVRSELSRCDARWHTDGHAPHVYSAIDHDSR